MKVWDYQIKQPLKSREARLWQTVRQIDWGEIEAVDLGFLRRHLMSLKNASIPAKDCCLNGIWPNMLDELQKLFFRFFVKQGLHKEFYFTGGTALAEVYLHHRRSFDLDFFSERPFDYSRLIALMSRFAGEHQLSEPQTEKKYDRRLFYFTNGRQLKVEFVKFEHKPLEPKYNWSEYGVEVDSLKDLTANKVLALIDRQEPKDAIDLYYLMTDKKFSLDDLLTLLKQKFGVGYARLSLAADLLRAAQASNELTPLLLASDQEAGIRSIQEFFETLADKTVPQQHLVK